MIGPHIASGLATPKRSVAQPDTRHSACRFTSATGREAIAGTPTATPGQKYDTGSYRRAIHRACDKTFPHPTLSSATKSKLTKEQLVELRHWQSAHRWSPNQLRHGAATRIRREFGLEAAQVALGHASADITQVYAEQDWQKGVEVARKIG